jgi:hypothetical protein
MRVLFSFVPLILFPFVAGFYSVGLALWAATGAACFVVAGDLLISHRSAKFLDVGQLLLFATLALFGTLLHPAWNESLVRLVINTGLLTIVLLSIVAARPFTLQYAREQAPERLWNSPGFISINYRISWVWAGAFAVSVMANLAKLFVPVIPHSADTTAGIAALVLAAKFTSWYPEHLRSSLRQNPSPDSED